jgi:hypothetical protein
MLIKMDMREPQKTRPRRIVALLDGNAKELTKYSMIQCDAPRTKRTQRQQIEATLIVLTKQLVESVVEGEQLLPIILVLEPVNGHWKHDLIAIGVFWKQST